MESILFVFLRTMQVLFLVGALGCVIAIPIIAVRMFAVLLGRDSEDERAT